MQLGVGSVAAGHLIDPLLCSWVARTIQQRPTSKAPACSASFASETMAEQIHERRHDLFRRIRSIFAIPVGHPVHDAQSEKTRKFGIAIGDAAVFNALRYESGGGRTYPC